MPSPRYGALSVLQMQVHVRLAAVAGVSDTADDLSCADAISRCDRDRARLEVRDKQELGRGHFQDHVIACRAKEPPLADGAIGFPIVDRPHNPTGRRQHRPAIAVVIVETRAVVPERPPLIGKEQIVRPPLIGDHGVVVDGKRRATPPDRHRAVKREQEAHIARAIVKGRRDMSGRLRAIR